MKIEECTEYGDIFTLVKQDVKKVLGKQRSGLMLVLGDLPAQIGAMHSLGSNALILNKAIVDSLEGIVKNGEKNFIIYGFLLHEYIHSLGYPDEIQTRRLCKKVCKEVYGDEHFTTKTAMEGPWKVYPELAYIQPRDFGESAEIVKSFDKTIDYIG